MPRQHMPCQMFFWLDAPPVPLQLLGYVRAIDSRASKAEVGVDHLAFG